MVGVEGRLHAESECFSPDGSDQGARRRPGKGETRKTMRAQRGLERLETEAPFDPGHIAL